MVRTLVCFHAHPDDEALLTAGVMAKAAAAGHRVVLVVATRGDVGEVAGHFLNADEELADRRWRELEQSAHILGVQRLEWLGYTDSGSSEHNAHDNQPIAHPHASFVAAAVDEAAGLLAEILNQEHADVLTSYDPNGGYGHPDHVQVHRVGARAAELANTPVVLEATIDRDLMRMGVELAFSLGYLLPPNFSPESFDNWYTPPHELTHAIDVRDQLAAKRSAMEAHASQTTAQDDDTTRSLEVFLSLPPDYFELAFGTEWFVDRTRPGGITIDDIFDPPPDPS